MKKTFIVLMTIILFTTGCEKESFTESDQFEQIELKKATVKVPMKCWFTAIPDPSLSMISCSEEIAVLSGGFMKGHATHGGKLKSELSCWHINECGFNDETFEMTGYIEGKNTVANGDYYFYTGVLHISVLDGKLSGKIIMDDGIGKYKGVKGELILTGIQDFVLNEATFTAEGFCTFKK